MYTSKTKVFISHASEDKAKIARPLAQALKRRKYEVWYDEFVLQTGDSLKRSIDRGLAECDFGIVILSPSFFAKRWTQDELGGLVARETADEAKLILPIWHQVDAAQIRKFSPTLADRIAVSTEKGTRHVVKNVVAAIEAEADANRARVMEFASPFGGMIRVSGMSNVGEAVELGRDAEGMEPFSEEDLSKLFDAVSASLEKSTLRKK